MRAVYLLSLCFPAAGDLSFLALGDWGGDGEEQPTTNSQRLTAAGLKVQANALEDVNFTLMMGDNFYHHGISSSAENSSRFKETFDDVYARILPHMKFFVLAGNHDYGQGRQGNISAQLAYSLLSKQWHFPALWYKIARRFPVGGGRTRSLEVLVIDTVILCGNGPQNEDIINNQLRNFAPNVNPHWFFKSLRQNVAEDQWRWIEGQLAGSSADYLWVAGHYPIWSGGEDGSTQCLIDRLRPMLVRHGAQYISGHDHMLEHFSHGGLDAFVVGAGMECCYSPERMFETPPGALQYMVAGPHGNESKPPTPSPVYGGFASLRFGADSAQVTFHAESGRPLYVSPPMFRRTMVVTARLIQDGAVPGLRQPWWVAPSLWLTLYGLLAAAFLRISRKRAMAMAAEAAAQLAAGEGRAPAVEPCPFLDWGSGS